MKKKSIYLGPQADWSEFATGSLVCDSYNSGIDDYEYEEVDWTVNP